MYWTGTGALQSKWRALEVCGAALLFFLESTPLTNGFAPVITAPARVARSMRKSWISWRSGAGAWAALIAIVVVGELFPNPILAGLSGEFWYLKMEV